MLCPLLQAKCGHSVPPELVSAFDPKRTLSRLRSCSQRGRGPGSLWLIAHGTEFGSSLLCYARRSGGRIQGEL